MPAPTRAEIVDDVCADRAAVELRAQLLGLVGIALEARLRHDLHQPDAMRSSLRRLAGAATDLADRLEPPGRAHLDDLPDTAAAGDVDPDDRDLHAALAHLHAAQLLPA